ncbi:penicillin-binding transpeptidase domain-containing protein, partial [Pantoea sp. SIMBA_133]
KAKTGAIEALSGGYSFGQSKYNRAIQARRQPGSTFKPFLYLSALESGMTPATIYNDAPIVFDDSELETAWRPQNSSGQFYGPTRLR